MRLRDSLSAAATTDDRHASMGAPAQQLLNDAPRALADVCGPRWTCPQSVAGILSYPFRIGYLSAALNAVNIVHA